MRRLVFFFSRSGGTAGERSEANDAVVLVKDNVVVLNQNVSQNNRSTIHRLNAKSVTLSGTATNLLQNCRRSDCERKRMIVIVVVPKCEIERRIARHVLAGHIEAVSVQNAARCRLVAHSHQIHALRAHGLKASRVNLKRKQIRKGKDK